MQKDEVVLSDVHLQVCNHQQKDYCVSRFFYTEDVNENRKKKLRIDPGELSRCSKHSDDTEKSEHLSPKNCLSELQSLKDIAGSKNTSDSSYNTRKDEDGDLDLKRRKRKIDYSSVITIAHRLETNLEKVGLQIWLASLYMTDFIVSNPEIFQGKRVIDLGAGVGLSSVVVSMYADHVICTDIGKDILDLAQHNLDMNSNMEVPNYKVEELDWFDNRFSSELDSESTRKQDEIESCDIIISADVIYDEDITESLFRTIYGLMTNTNIKTWYISLEKRYVFTLKDLDIACPAYQHFRECLNQLEDFSDGIQFKATLVDEFPQCFHYTRTKELELWKVTVNKKTEK